MASPQIMLSVSLAAAAVIYSFWCNILITRKASGIRDRLIREAPGPWSELNPIARSWHGGQPGIKLLYRNKRVLLAGFEDEVLELLDLERRMLWGLGVGVACIMIAVGGTELWGWQW